MSNPITAGLIVIIALMGGFYGGFRYESGQVTKAPASSTAGSTSDGGRNAAGGSGNLGGFAGGGGGGIAGGGGAGFGGRGNAGTITDLTSSGFTLHGLNGTDTKVTFGSNPTVRKTTTGALSDLSDNLTVTVSGQRDSSGNLIATTITIVPTPTTTGG